MRVMLLGCGYWGQKLLRHLDRQVGAANVAVVDPDFRRGPPERTHRDHRPLLAAVNYVEAVVIATPPDTHYALARECLLADKHVLVEKPLALRPREAEELVALARAHERALLVDDTWHHHLPLRSRLLPAQGQGRLHLWWANHRVELTREGLLWTLGPHPISLLLRHTPATPGSLRLVQAAPREIAITSQYGSVWLSWRAMKERRLVLTYTEGNPPESRVVPWQDGVAPPREPLEVLIEHYLQEAIPQRTVDQHAVTVVEALAVVQEQLEGMAR